MDSLLYEAESVHRFCGLTLSGPVTDETTISHVCHLLELHALDSPVFEWVGVVHEFAL